VVIFHATRFAVVDAFLYGAAVFSLCCFLFYNYMFKSFWYWCHHFIFCISSVVSIVLNT